MTIIIIKIITKISLKIKENEKNIYIKTKSKENLDMIYNIEIDIENKEEKILNNKADISEILETVNKEFNNDVIKKLEKEIPYKKEMDLINQKIEMTKKDFVSFEVDSKIKTSKELEEQQNKIRKQIEELKYKLNEINKAEDINKIKNDFEILRLDNNKFLSGEIIEEFEMIYIHQKRILNQKIKDEEKLNELKKQAKEEELRIKREEKLKKDKEKMQEFRNRNKEDLFIVEDYIKKDIGKVSKEIEKLNKMLKKDRNKKSFPLFKSIFSNTLRFGVTLLPLGLFKNKSLGNLLSMVLLNNKIRTMRNVVKKQDVKYLDVELLLDNIKKNSDITKKNITICDDSLYQLVYLKEEFLKEYENYIGIEEVSQTLNKIEVLENTLVKQKEKLANAKEELNKMKVKIKNN